MIIMPPALPAFSPNFIMYSLGLATYIEPMFLQVSEEPESSLGLTAIVPAYNEERSIARTLESLIAQTNGLEGIIVVDDGSVDGTSEIAGSFEGVRLIRNPRHIGKAESINRVLDLVDTDLVMIVDADTVLDESYADKAVKKFIKEDVVAASGFVIPSMESVNSSIRRARVVEDFYSQTTLKRGQNSINGIFVISGCCAVFRTSVLKRSRIPTGTVTEDLDLTWFLEREGHRTALIDAYAHTLEPRGLNEYINQIKRWYTGFFQCLVKHGVKVFSSKALALTLTSILIECLIFTLFWASAIGLVVLVPWLSGELSFLRWFVLTMILVDLATVCFPAILKARDAGFSNDFLSGLPIYYSLRIVNTFVWWATLIEWLFGWGATWKTTH